jgi:hypothetical protein
MYYRYFYSIISNYVLMSGAGQESYQIFFFLNQVQFELV